AASEMRSAECRVRNTDKDGPAAVGAPHSAFRTPHSALPKFRHFVCGAGTLSVALAERFEEQFGLCILHGYGLSETTCYSCFLPIDIDAAEHRRWMRDWGYPSIG